MNRVCVIIPIHTIKLSKEEMFSLEWNLEKLKDYPICFVLPIGLKLPSSINKKNHKKEYFKQKYFKSKKGYNKLLLTKNFYKRFTSYEFILICQTDVLIIKNNLDSWCKKDFDYIGAPWVIKEKDEYTILGVGNGGLSLRKVKTFIKTLESKQYFHSKYQISSLYLWFNIKNILLIKCCVYLRKLNIKLNYLKFFLYLFRWTDKYHHEDIFWGKYALFFNPNYKIAKQKDAFLFSFENEPEYCLKQTNGELPFGTHKWFTIAPNFWKKHLKIKIKA